jgi:hypothetical protein
VVDDLEVLLQLGELGGHVGAVGLHEGKPFLLVTGSGGYELGVAPDGLDGHAGGPQPGADGNPVEVELVVAPSAAGGAVDGGDDQAGAFVVAQGVHADPGAASGLGDAEARPGAGARGPGYWLRLDFEHALNLSVVVSNIPRRSCCRGWRAGPEDHYVAGRSRPVTMRPPVENDTSRHRSCDR